MVGENRASETGGKQANSCLCWAFSGDRISQTAEPRDKKTRCFLTFLGKTSVDIMQELCFFFFPLVWHTSSEPSVQTGLWAVCRAGGWSPSWCLTASRAAPVSGTQTTSSRRRWWNLDRGTDKPSISLLLWGKVEEWNLFRALLFSTNITMISGYDAWIYWENRLKLILKIPDWNLAWCVDTKTSYYGVCTGWKHTSAKHPVNNNDQVQTGP